MDTWIIIGLLAGLISSALTKQVGWSLLGQIEFGVLGAILGDCMLSRAGPLLASRAHDVAIVRSLLGAVVALVLVNLVMRMMGERVSLGGGM
jgi:uncharacterized membrane protein YeaQ/YmgE (transglycosylase-associated protein family)